MSALQDEDIRAVVLETLAEQQRLHRDEVAKTLKDVGFQSVTLQLNLGREQLLDALKEFAKEAENADWAVGHGIEAAGINYLIPADAKITSDRDIDLEATPIDQVLNAAERAVRCG